MDFIDIITGIAALIVPLAALRFPLGGRRDRSDNPEASDPSTPEQSLRGQSK